MHVIYAYKMALPCVFWSSQSHDGPLLRLLIFPVNSLRCNFGYLYIDDSNNNTELGDIHYISFLYTFFQTFVLYTIKNAKF